MDSVELAHLPQKTHLTSTDIARIAEIWGILPSQVIESLSGRALLTWMLGFDAYAYAYTMGKRVWGGGDDGSLLVIYGAEATVTYLHTHFASDLETIGYLNADLLARVTGLPEFLFRDLHASDMYHTTGKLVTGIPGAVRQLAKDAVDTGWVGEILSSYDGKTHTLAFDACGKDVFYFFRRDW